MSDDSFVVDFFGADLAERATWEDIARFVGGETRYMGEPVDVLEAWDGGYVAADVPEWARARGVSPPPHCVIHLRLRRPT